MPTYITAAEVRNACGAPTSLISNTTIEGFINIVEKEVERFLNTKFSPTLKIDIIDGTARDNFFVTKKPLLNVRALKSNDTTITPRYLHIYKESGKILLGEDAELGQFISKARDIWCKYYFGMVEDTSTTTASTGAVTYGTVKTVAVTSSTGFTALDWVEITGMDGYKEVAQISSIPGTTSIIVDELIFNHESGSIVTKVSIPDYIKRIMILEGCIAVAINAIGGTYTFNTSYNIGELAVTKGEPYPQWREVILRSINERDMRMAKIKPRFHMAVG